MDNPVLSVACVCAGVWIIIVVFITLAFQQDQKDSVEHWDTFCSKIDASPVKDPSGDTTCVRNHVVVYP